MAKIKDYVQQIFSEVGNNPDSEPTLKVLLGAVQSGLIANPKRSPYRKLVLLACIAQTDRFNRPPKFVLEAVEVFALRTMLGKHILKLSEYGVPSVRQLQRSPLHCAINLYRYSKPRD